MSFSSDDDIDVDTFLESVDKSLKFSSTRIDNKNDENFDLRTHLNLLSDEFEALGLPTFTIEQPNYVLLKDIIYITRTLIKDYQNTLAKLNDEQTNNYNTRTKMEVMEKKQGNLHEKIDELKKVNDRLKNNLNKTNDNYSSAKKSLENHNSDVDRNKRFYIEKCLKLERKIYQLQQENQHLMVLCGKYIANNSISQDPLAKVLKLTNHREDILKSTIEKLEEDNSKLLDEISKLHEDLVLAQL